MFSYLRTTKRKYMRVYYSPRSPPHRLLAALLQTFCLLPGTEVLPALVVESEESGPVRIPSLLSALLQVSLVYSFSTAAV